MDFEEKKNTLLLVKNIPVFIHNLFLLYVNCPNAHRQPSIPLLPLDPRRPLRPLAARQPRQPHGAGSAPHGHHVLRQHALELL